MVRFSAQRLDYSSAPLRRGSAFRRILGYGRQRGFDIAWHLHVETLPFEIGQYRRGGFLPQPALRSQFEAECKFGFAEFPEHRSRQAFEAVLVSQVHVEAGASGTAIDVGLHGSGV